MSAIRFSFVSTCGGIIRRKSAATSHKYKLGSQAIYNSRAAQKHLTKADAHFEQTQSKKLGEQFAGLARGTLALAMAKMALNITIASLGKGHHIECKDLEELLEAEDTVRSACKNVTRYLEIADTFNGSETVIEYEKGEEKVHINQGATPLLTYASAAQSASAPSNDDDSAYRSPTADIEKKIAELWEPSFFRKATYATGAFLFVIILVHSCS